MPTLFIPKFCSTALSWLSWLHLLLIGLLFVNLPGHAAETVTAIPTATSPNITKENSGQTTAIASQPSVDEPKELAQEQLENSMDNVKVIQKTLETLRKEIDTSKKGAVLNRSTIKDGLDIINTQLKDAHSELDKMSNTLNTQAMNLEKVRNEHASNLEKMKADLLALDRKVTITNSDITSQKYLIENYAAGGYEILLKMADIGSKLDKLSQGQTLQNDQKQDQRISMIKDLNHLWILLAIVLVSFTPLAFALSNSREQYKLLIDGVSLQQGMILACIGLFLGYFILGFGLMFGKSVAGFIGISNYILQETATPPNTTTLYTFAEFNLYQIGSVLLAGLIIYTAIGRQLSSKEHLVLALFVGSILIPIFGHWSRASQYFSDNKGWLEWLGFLDTAGSTTIHTVAACFAVVLVWKLRFRKPLPDSQQTEDDLVYSISTVLLLWLSSLGLTTGNLSISSYQIAPTMLNVGLVACTAALSAYLHYSFYAVKGLVSRALSGFVTGLVAVSASAPMLSFLEAVFMGIVVGILHNVAFTLLRKFVLTQTWQIRTAYIGAIHGAGGIFGALCVAVFGSEGLFAWPDMGQLLSQLEGITVALIYSAGLACGIFFLLELNRPGFLGGSNV